MPQKILLAAILAFVAWKLAFPGRGGTPPSPPPPPPTNSMCGHCGHRFMAYWASVATCPRCGKSMPAKLARRAHGVARNTAPPKAAPSIDKGH